MGRLAVLGVSDVDSVSLPGRVGEGRACWSLGNAYVSMGSPAQALTFAKKHLEISQEVSQACPPLGPQPLLCPHWRPSVLPSPPQPGWVPLCALVCSRLFPCPFRAVAECCTGRATHVRTPAGCLSAIAGGGAGGAGELFSTPRMSVCPVGRSTPGSFCPQRNWPGWA